MTQKLKSKTFKLYRNYYKYNMYTENSNQIKCKIK